jgi:predicted transcriptional regulator
MIEKLLKEAELHRFVNISEISRKYGVSSKTIRSYLKGVYPIQSKDFAVKIIFEALKEAKKTFEKIEFKEIEEALQ